ncbi:MAG: hypothetical protein AAF762_01335 [Pseudomonadota bacterium]
MDNNWLSLAAPLSAIAIALITTIFNIYDSRRRHAVEKIKLDAHAKDSLFQATEFLSDKYRASKLLLLECTRINNLCRELESMDPNPLDIGTVKEISDEIEVSLEAARIIVASDQASLSLNLHDEFNSRTLPKVRKMLGDIATPKQPLRNTAIEVKGLVTEFKRYVESELHAAAFSRST